MHLRAIAVLATVLATAGCGSGDVYAPVSGVVTASGRPVEGVRVTFQPAERGAAARSVATTGASGEYRLARPVSGDAGALVATHRVSMTTLAPNPNANEATPMPRELVPPRYRDGSVRIDVPAAGLQNAHFDLAN